MLPTMNMQELKIFRYINLMSSLQGVNCITIKTRWVRYFMKIIKIIVHIHAWQIIGRKMHGYIAFGNVSNLFDTSFFISTYLCFIFLSINLEKVVANLVHVGEQLFNSKTERILIKMEKLTLIVFSLVCFVTWMSGVVDRSFDYFHPTNETTNLTNYFGITTVVESPLKSTICSSIYSFIVMILSESYLYASVLIYCYIVYVIFQMKKSFLGLIKKEKVPFDQLRLLWLKIIICGNKFEDSLNTIPFITVTTIFIDVTAVVISFCKPKDVSFSESNLNQKVDRICPWLYEVAFSIPIIAMPIIVTHCERKLKRHLDDLKYELICKKRMNSETDSLIRDVRSSFEMNLTGMRMFKLNQEFVLAFISSVITFSVLFLQLSQS